MSGEPLTHVATTVFFPQTAAVVLPDDREQLTLELTGGHVEAADGVDQVHVRAVAVLLQVVVLHRGLTVYGLAPPLSRLYRTYVRLVKAYLTRWINKKRGIVLAGQSSNPVDQSD